MIEDGTQLSSSNLVERSSHLSETEDVFRVLIADSQPLFQGALASLVASSLEVEWIKSAKNPKELLDQLKYEPSLIFVDAELLPRFGCPPVEGATAEHDPLFAALCNSATVVALGMLPVREVAWLLDQGCAGFIRRSTSTEDLAGLLDLLATDPPAVLCDRETSVDLLIHLRSESRASTEDFTMQDLRLLELLREGASNVEMAADLDVSKSTITRSLRTLYRRLNAANRTEAAARAALLHTDPSLWP